MSAEAADRIREALGTRPRHSRGYTEVTAGDVAAVAAPFAAADKIAHGLHLGASANGEETPVHQRTDHLYQLLDLVDQAAAAKAPPEA